MSGVFLTLMRMSAAGALVILAVLPARLMLRRFPRKYVCLLWLVALFRLLCPVTLRAPTSVVPEAVESGALVSAWTESYAEETRVIQRGEPGYKDALAAGWTPVSGYPPAGLTGKAEAPSDPVETGETPSEPVGSGTTAHNYVVTAADGLSEPKRAGEVWLPVLSWAWLGGAAALLLWSVFNYLRLRFRLREAVKLDKGIYQAEGLTTPFVLGVLRPRICLPWDMAAEDRAWVLRHEQAHLKRLDPLWKLLGWLALCLHWFNPLCWLAFFLAVRDMEGACDEAVIRSLDGEERAAYSGLLLRLSAGKPLFAATPLGFGEGNVKQRIKSVLRWRKPKAWMAVLAGVLIAAVVLLFALGPGKGRKDFPDIKDTPDTWPQMSFFKQEWTEVCAGQRGVWPVEDVGGLKKELTKLLAEGEWHIGGIDATGADMDAGGKIVIDWNQYMPGKIRWVSMGEQWELYVGRSFLGLARDGAYCWLGNAVAGSDSPDRDYMGDTERMEALLALTEWGRPPFTLTPGEDLTLCGIPWGAAMEEAGKMLPTASEGERCLIVNDASLCGYRTDAVFDFGEDEGGTFLLGVSLTFREESESFSQDRFDRSVLCEELSKVWGERQIFLPDPDDSRTHIDDFGHPERLWYWYTEDFSDEYRWLSGVIAWFERTGDPRVLYLDASGRNMAAGRRFELPKNDVTKTEAGYLLEWAGKQLTAEWTKKAVGGTMKTDKYDYLEITVRSEEDFRLMSERLAAVPWYHVILEETEAAPEPEPTPSLPPEPAPGYALTEGWEELSAAELGEWIAATHTYIEDEDGNWVYNTMSCCFTSRYTDPTELDLYEFLRYYDFTENASEEEYRALSAAGLMGVLNPWWHAEDFPVPLHRVPAARVEADLQRYFGIGLSDLKTDWRLCCDYLPEYDCFYLMTSDWGPGTFQPNWGEKQGDRLRLWRGYTSLSLRWAGDRWVIESFLTEGTEANTGTNALRSRTVTVSDGRTLRREVDYVFIPSDAEYRAEPRGEKAGVFKAGTRLFLCSEYLYNDGELWLQVSEETYNAPAEQGWVRTSDVEIWTGSAEQQTALRSPVWLPANITYYPANFDGGTTDSPEGCLKPENARTHGYDLTGSILALEGDYALVSLGQLEVWALRDSLIVGIPLQHTEEPELKYLYYGRVGAEMENLGHPLAEWGAELVWHRGKAEGEEHYTAYYPTTDGSGTVAAVFTSRMLFQPQQIVLIPPGAEEWP